MLINLAGPYVVGVDAGGTHTRATVVTMPGSVAGYSVGPGANANSGGDTAGALTRALQSAIGDLDPLHIVGGVFGIAGAGAAGRPRAVAAANTAWRAAGIPGSPVVVTDIAVAYAAATDKPAGLVVFAGTGAGAAVIDDGEIVRRADGYGWLVGDEGSAVWLGREAVRAALAAYDGRGAPTLLAETVPQLLLGEDVAGPLVATHGVPEGRRPTRRKRLGAMSSRSVLPQAVIKEVYAQPPAALGRLAPLVSQAATEGDQVAKRIVDEAARWLLSDVDAVRPALAELGLYGAGPIHSRRVDTLRDHGEPRSLVEPPTLSRAGKDLAATDRRQISRTSPGIAIAGSLLAQGPVAEAVHAGLRSRFGTEPEPARDGAMGAARMALRRILGDLPA